ncbi:MAG: YggS family pyridoxal phosphate-dependent enzyme [Candidatus Omnitrophica bacterium]|nr:YggS family pyridoxal phosphate-dependent enzyme [Candidatus Omnitrophota bacterium]
MSIAERVQELFLEIESLAREAGRRPEEITVVAATKTVGAAGILEAAASGIAHYGENRLQEAEAKAPDLSGATGLTSHFIGRIQTNKLRRILALFDVIQSVDRPEVLDKIERILAESGVTKTAYLEVNISGEGTKAGFIPEELDSWFGQKLFERYPHVVIRGLMTVGAPDGDSTEIRRDFRRMREHFEKFRRIDPRLEVLSMGMSQDFPEAILEGSTMIRVGTRIFGERAQAAPPPKSSA